MAKKVSKWFRIGVEGDTCDGRVISGADIQEMADTYDARVYGARINLEHIRGLLPDGPFKRYGDVVELKAEKIDDDSALNGKLALFAKITPSDELVAMNKALQKVYTSMEIRPNFSNSGKCYLTGLAVTDDPASLGTEYLEFCSRAAANPLAGRKERPEDLFSVATLAVLKFEEQPDTVFTALADKVKGIFSRRQADDDARFNDVHEAVTVVTEQVQANQEAAEQRLSAVELSLQTLTEELTGKLAESQQKLSALETSLDGTESFTQARRLPASGGNGDSLLTNC